MRLINILKTSCCFTRTFDLTRGLLPAAVDFGGQRNGLEQSTLKNAVRSYIAQDFDGMEYLRGDAIQGRT